MTDEQEKEKQEPEDDTKEEVEETKEEGTAGSIEEAKVVVKELREQNVLLEKNLERAEKMEIDNMLSGRSSAGAPKEKKVETPEEYAKKVMAGEIGN